MAEDAYRERALKILPWICVRCAREFPVSRLRESAVVPTIIRLKSSVRNEELHRLDEMIKNIDAQMDALERDYRDHQT